MNNNIRKLIEDNWEDIKELIAQKAEAEQKHKTIWDLKTEDGEEYYVLWSDGSTGCHIFNSQDDEVLREMGNVFLTREEAEFERERRKIEAIIRKYSRPFTKQKRNYYIYYDYGFNGVVIDIYHSVSDGIPYFESKEIAQKVINEIGEDRLKKYWFGVNE